MNQLLERVDLEINEIKNKYNNIAISNKENSKELLSKEQKIMYLKEVTEMKLAREVILGDPREKIRFLNTQKEMSEEYVKLSAEMLRRLKKENIVENSGYDKNIYIISEYFFEKVKQKYYN